jgi:hypothetical protein
LGQVKDMFFLPVTHLPSAKKLSTRPGTTPEDSDATVDNTAETSIEQYEEMAWGFGIGGGRRYSPRIFKNPFPESESVVAVLAKESPCK